MLQDALIILLAGLVGYGTNWLAVKMLFRPRRAVFVLGRRVPFTPGMIPARREEIVDGIAAGVAQHILNADVIERELRGVDLLGPIEDHVRRLVERLAEEPGTTEEARRQVGLAADRLAASEPLKDALADRIKPGLRAGLGGAAAGGTLLITGLPWLNRLPRKTIASFAAGAAALAAERFAADIAGRLTRAAGDAVRQAADDGLVDQAARDALRGVPDALFDKDGAMRANLERGLRDAIPEAARSIDVHGVVRRRLDSFDADALEDLVMRASRTHLRAITVLGGVIGAAIGVLQVVLRRTLG